MSAEEPIHSFDQGPNGQTDAQAMNGSWLDSFMSRDNVWAQRRTHQYEGHSTAWVIIQDLQDEIHHGVNRDPDLRQKLRVLIKVFRNLAGPHLIPREKRSLTDLFAREPQQRLNTPELIRTIPQVKDELYWIRQEFGLPLAFPRDPRE